MRRAALTRFHLLALNTLFLCGAALMLKSVALFVAVLIVYVVLLGLGVTFPQMKLFGPFVCKGKGDRREVSLTFDDGPDPRSTPPLLDLLRDTKVQAAFFCVGKRVAAEPQLAARIAAEGHLLGNHSYSHSNLTNFFTVARLRDELARTQAVIQESAGATPRWFRPPMGLSNPRIFKAAHLLGLQVVGWMARGLDTRTKNPQTVVNRIVRRLKPGAIILLHDGDVPSDRLVITVKTLLDRVRALGYEVVRLDHLLS